MIVAVVSRAEPSHVKHPRNQAGASFSNKLLAYNLTFCHIC